MTILSFGHIPSWAGGRQESGLANVIYQLARNMSVCEDVQLTMAATDVFKPVRQDGKLTIYGWTKCILIKYALMHPILSLKWLLIVINSKKKYGPIISVPGYFFKGLHLARTIELVSPDMVHLHGMTACVYEQIVPSSVKIIVTMHGIIGEDKTIPNQYSLYQMEKEICSSTRFSFIGFIAEQLIADFKKVYGLINAPAIVIPNAYDSKSFYYIEHNKQSKLTLCTIASLSENKGQSRVLEAIGKSGLDIRYICIGAGTAQKIQHNETIAEKYGIDYTFEGKKQPSEIREILSNADFMILPSSTEGFGLVYLEALACGVPVILPKHLPIVHEKNIIQPETNAILIDDSSSSSIESILPKLKDMHFDRRAISKNVLSYTWEGIALQYVNTIKSIIKT